MRRWILRLTAIALPLNPVSIANAQSSVVVKVRDPNISERAYIAATAYHAIRRYFAHAEGLPAGYDFEARYRQYLDEAMTAKDRRTFSLATMRFFASLHNGHTSFTDESLGQNTGPAPFRIRPIDGRWTVIRSRTPGLFPGDDIVTVDGKPVAEWIAPVRGHIGQSGAAALDRLTWVPTFLLPKRFSLDLDDGRHVPVDLGQPAIGPERGMILPSEVETFTRSDGLVVIRIPSFGDPRFEAAAVKAVQSLQASQPVLIDLRGNGGGNTPTDLLSAVMTRPYRGTMYVTPMTIAANDASESFDGTLPALPHLMMRYGPDMTSPAAASWRGKIALLVDGGCGSACEDFVLRFKDGKRGVVLGEPTFGSTGQPYLVRFPEFGMSFRVSSKREYFPDGQPFEGIGVQPDRVIPVYRAELRRGADDQLEAAARIALAK